MLDVAHVGVENNWIRHPSCIKMPNRAFNNSCRFLKKIILISANSLFKTTDPLINCRSRGKEVQLCDIYYASCLVDG